MKMSVLVREETDFEFVESFANVVLVRKEHWDDDDRPMATRDTVAHVQLWQNLWFE